MRLSDKHSTLFPYESVRDSQVDGIDTIDRAIEKDGIVTIEGACGTGKTLTALIPYIAEVRSNESDADRILAVTSVKQQMEAFQDEVKRINSNLPDGVRSISGITLVGLSDLHPYIRSDVVNEGYDSIDKLREGTRKLANEKKHSYSYNDLYKRSLKEDSDKPYGESIPSANGIRYDPYYAKYQAEYDRDDDNVQEVLPFDISRSGMMTVNDMRNICSSAGYCPHSMMRIAIEEVDIVIGNYMHAFDENTVKRISNPIIDENTLAVFDEAHNLVPRVRQFLSDEVPLTSIQRTCEELREIRLLIRLSELDSNQVQSLKSSALSDQSVSDFAEVDQEITEEIEKVISSSASVTSGGNNLYEKSKNALDIIENEGLDKNDITRCRKFLQDLISVTEGLIDDNLPLKDGESIRLRNPENPEADKISNWIKLSGYSSIVKKAEKVGNISSLIRQELTPVSDRPKTSSKKVGHILSSWYTKDNIRYYRSVEMENRMKSSGFGEYKWQRDLKANLTIHNCIPKNEISDRIDSFKSSVLMSATLEPMDVYRRTTGIDELQSGDRKVYECRYGLSFPDENRATFGVDADKFKYKNRGKAFDSFGPKTDNQTREQYKDIIFDIVNETDGNIMIVMPSYNEAEWIGSLLEQSYMCRSDNIYIDESSTNRETQNLKNKFFSSDDAVLATAARGTLIEGIDYIGDRLNAVAVCGVPITNTSSDYKKSIKSAYDEIFQDMDGFELAFTIPATRKARQAMGRVIRTQDDEGIRVLVDERYVDNTSWDSVYDYLSPAEQNEMQYISPKDTDIAVSSFWDVRKKKNSK